MVAVSRSNEPDETKSTNGLSFWTVSRTPLTLFNLVGFGFSYASRSLKVGQTVWKQATIVGNFGLVFEWKVGWELLAYCWFSVLRPRAIQNRSK